ncbi:MAG: hypothetical protein Kilf2KO_37880 [Rhodospirillales bacterium]
MDSSSIVDQARRSADRQTRRAERRRRVREGRFDSSVPSPCIAICQMDADNRFCVGCHRSIDEIRDWMIMTADEKQAALKRIEDAK